MILKLAQFNFSSSYYHNGKSIWKFEKIIQNTVDKLNLAFAKKERISNQKN